MNTNETTSNEDASKAEGFTNPNSYKAWFDALEPNDQRMVLAEEALVLAKSKVVVPRNGDYWRTLSHINQINHVDPIPITPNTLCSVCQLGGLFASFLKIEGSGVEALRTARYGYGLGTPGAEYRMRNILRRYFSPRTLTLMETAFEEYVMIDDCDDTTITEQGKQDILQAVAFHNHYKTPEERYEAILCNIIHHDGEFVPGALTKRLPVNQTALNARLSGQEEAGEETITKPQNM